MFQCENELKYWDGQGPAQGPTNRPVISDFLPAQLEAVLVEVKMLEEAAMKNEEEIHGHEDGERAGGGGGFRGELDQLKHRLGKTIERYSLQFFQTDTQTVRERLQTVYSLIDNFRNDGH